MPVGGMFVIGFDTVGQDRQQSSGPGDPKLVRPPDGNSLACYVSVGSRARIVFINPDDVADFESPDRLQQLLETTGFSLSSGPPAYFPFAKPIGFSAEDVEGASLSVIWLRLYSNLEVRRLTG